MATVPEIIEEQRNYVADFQEDMDGFINVVADLSTTTFDVIPEIDMFDYQWSNRAHDFLTAVAALSPTRPTFNFSQNTPPTAPEFTSVTIAPVLVDDFTKAPPEINIPEAPDASIPTAPTSPTFVEPVIPDAPTLSFPVVPEFGVLTLPEPPSIQIPSFGAVSPDDDLTAPSNQFAFYEQAYSSTLLDAVKLKLLTDIEEGGYGIDTADEVSLWERARAREYDLATAQIAEIRSTGAIRGFELPPGDLNVAIQVAHQDLQNKVSTLNRDIALKRADLYVDNRKFTIQQARELEQILINYHNSLMERTLNAAKAALDAEISVFNALVARYNARLDAYKTEAQVFEAQIRASLAQVEIYRTTMEGKRIELEAQRTQVDVYRAQLSGIESLVNIYRTRMEAANVQANIQRTKLEAFRAQVDAFSQTVQAKVAEFNMFESRIKGETAKMQAYDSEVRAYGAKVDATKTRADIQVANARVQVEQYQAQISAYNGQLEQFKATLQGDLAFLQSLVSRYQVDVSAQSSKIDGLRAAYMLELEDGKRQDVINIEKVKTNMGIAQFQLQQLVEAARLRNSAAQYGSEFYKSIVAMTLSSVNTLAVQTQSV